MWRAVCTRPGNVFTATWLIGDYYQFRLHAGELQPAIRTEVEFNRFANLRRSATDCPNHCITCVAQDVRGMLTWRHPHLPPVCTGSIHRAFNCGRGLRSLQDLTIHVNARADDSHAPPVSQFHFWHFPISETFWACQSLVRFFALHRIKPHNPLIVRAPVNSFEFHSCEHTPQAGNLTR